MSVKFNINEAIKVWKKDGGQTKFEDSLRDVLKFMQNDKNISNIEKQNKQNNIKSAYYQSKRWLHFYTCNHCEKSHNYNKVIPLPQTQTQTQTQTPVIKTTTTIKTTTFKEEP